MYLPIGASPDELAYKVDSYAREVILEIFSPHKDLRAVPVAW